jgi:Spy/CpxP family protein refolding chaperone
MKRLKLFLLAFSITLLIGVGSAFGQDAPEKGSPTAQPQGEERPNLFAALGLTPEQFRQLRQINQERKPQMMAAQRRLRMANRDLDMAIYADVVNDDDVQARLKEFSDAQAEVARLRFTNELAVRKVLTNDQLIRFRELRRRFAEARQKIQKQQNSDRPMRPIERLKRQLPNN